MIDWPKVLTIPTEIRDFKKRFLAVLRGEDDNAEIEKELVLNYITAVSSGKAVTEEIPKQIGRRAGWASQQGANFVEIIIENPTQLIMDQDMLINLAQSLNLHYNIHSSTSFAYGSSYRVGRQNGYDPAHEYTVKLLKEAKRFRRRLQEEGLDPAEDGLPRLYTINPHMAVSPMPPEEERLAQDVSVDPFGEEFKESRIFENPEARKAIFKYVIWEREDINDDPQQFQQILGVIDAPDVRGGGEYIQQHLIDLLEEEGFVDQELLTFTRDLVKDEVASQLQLARQAFNLSDFQLQDLPKDIESLRNHYRGQQFAQQLATFDPQENWDQLPEDRREGIRTQLEENDSNLSFPEDFPDTKRLNLSKNTWQDLNEQASRMLVDEDGPAFQHLMEFLGQDDENYKPKQSPAHVMRTMAGSRRLFQEEFNKESSIFRRVIPLWMPFADEEHIQELWRGITGESFTDHEKLINWLYHGSRRKKSAMNDPRKEEDVIAAATGAYVWGHFTQLVPGYDKTLVQHLEEAGMFMSFEAHFAGAAETTRIWKPKDMIEVVKAINDTPVPWYEDGHELEYRTTDQCRITIDMEHLATQKVNPLWVIDPNEEGEKEGYKGLEEGDGALIQMQHVTHPYIGEQQPGHFHGPIQRGDTLVYDYIYALIDKGMAKTNPAEKPAVFMYEMGGEKTETMFLLRLILRMIEYGIEPEELKGPQLVDVINKDQPENLKEYLIQKFFGVTDTEVQHEWQEIFEHALDPLEDLLKTTKGTHTWQGRGALGEDNRPEEWNEEEYQ